MNIIIVELSMYYDCFFFNSAFITINYCLFLHLLNLKYLPLIFPEVQQNCQIPSNTVFQMPSVNKFIDSIFPLDPLYFC